jgi:small conductance mechanosensitive channel
MLASASSAVPQDETAAQARAVLGELYAQVESFVMGVLSLDPEQAALKAGLTLLVVVGALLLLVILRMLLKAIAARLAPAQGDGRAPAFKLGGWTMPIARLAVFLGGALLALQIWGVDLAALMQGPLGAALAIAGRAALIIVVMLGAVEVSQFAIARVFHGAAEAAREPRRAAQLRTIAPVVSGVVTTVLLVIATMMVLGQVGVEIGPLLAGAGIVGLAVGFGAQTLVKDFLTGMFLIIEDTVSVGDVARIGDASGLVEDMSLRTIKLRAFDGTLQVIPYGEAQIIHNMTKGFSYYVFDLSISYSSDILKALDLMKQTGEDLQRDPEFGALILEPIEIFGVDRLADSGVVLKARIKTLPIKQWTVGREYLKRIKLAFDSAGIEIPFPHLKLVPPDHPIPVGEVEHARAAE